MKKIILLVPLVALVAVIAAMVSISFKNTARAVESGTNEPVILTTPSADSFTETVTTPESISSSPTATQLPTDEAELLSEILYYRDNGSTMPPDLIEAVKKAYVNAGNEPGLHYDLPQRPYPDDSGLFFPDFYFRSDADGYFEKYHDYMHFTTYKEIHIKPGEVIEVPILQTSKSIFSDMTPIITYTGFDDNVIDVIPISEYDGSGFDHNLIDLRYWDENIRNVGSVSKGYSIFGIYYSSSRNFVVEAKATGATQIHVYGYNYANEDDPNYDYIDKREFTVIDVYIDVYVEE